MARIADEKAIYGDGRLLELDKDGKEDPKVVVVMPVSEMPQEDERAKTNYSEK